jgi:hypothetical protein
LGNKEAGECIHSEDEMVIKFFQCAVSFISAHLKRIFPRFARKNCQIMSLQRGKNRTETGG